jgi:hypothetical protein
MPESYFNADQEAHMASLARIPREQRCGSGWHLIGECYGRPCSVSEWHWYIEKVDGAAGCAVVGCPFTPEQHKRTKPVE